MLRAGEAVGTPAQDTGAGDACVRAMAHGWAGQTHCAICAIGLEQLEPCAGSTSIHQWPTLLVLGGYSYGRGRTQTDGRQTQTWHLPGGASSPCMLTETPVAGDSSGGWGWAQAASHGDISPRGR